MSTWTRTSCKRQCGPAHCPRLDAALASLFSLFPRIATHPLSIFSLLAAPLAAWKADAQLFYFMYGGTCYTMTPMLRVRK
jgi:hypothetical protein